MYSSHSNRVHRTQCERHSSSAAVLLFPYLDAASTAHAHPTRQQATDSQAIAIFLTRDTVWLDTVRAVTVLWAHEMAISPSTPLSLLPVSLMGLWGLGWALTHPDHSIASPFGGWEGLDCFKLGALKLGRPEGFTRNHSLAAGWSRASDSDKVNISEFWEKSQACEKLEQLNLETVGDQSIPCKILFEI